MEHMTPLKRSSGLYGSLTIPQFTTPSPRSNLTASNLNLPGSSAPEHPPPRTHLCTPKRNFELLASKTVSRAISEEAIVAKLPASPVDSSHSSLHPRFPRFSIASDSSHSDLPTDGVTSTKISSDGEAIVATRRSANASRIRSRKRQKLQVTLHRAISTPTLELRRIGSQIKRAPSVILSRRTSRWLRRTISKSEAEVHSTC